ncbi:hypothetical protein BDR04DRAFT_1128884 [Suillus decipiens]|nr:hypothetical protein BDR04DRAFT_1128884 [Suillus decipiens]
MTFLDNDNYQREDAQTYGNDKSNLFHIENGWWSSSIKIHLPKEREKFPSEDKAPEMEIPGVYHCSITNIITSVFEDSIASTFHMMPFQQLWKVSDRHTVNVYSEAYFSPAFWEAHEEINSLPHDPNDDLEHVIASLMMWSDVTHLASFGDASLWLIYLLFRNQSKYTSGKPTVSACHHVAYIPTLPDNFQDIYISIFCEASSNNMYTHCKHELMQYIWALLLNEKFMHAYKYGIIHQVFPQFFSYLADYPEKILLACIKFLSECPCPHCLIKKADVPKMGTKLNMRHINSQYVKNFLQEESLVPTCNTFSECLADFQFKLFLLFIVDPLHKFELGVWKAMFTHLMHILFAAGGTAIQELNWRYHKVPTFGRGTI